MHQKNVVKKKFADLLLIGKKGKRYYFLFKGFNTFMYDHTLHRGRKHFVVIVYELLEQQKN